VSAGCDIGSAPAYTEEPKKTARMSQARQPFEHEHVCRLCFQTVVCFLESCPIDYKAGQWLGGLTLCFDCGENEAPTATKDTTVPER
jgi:hypothetical protein